ncbi:60S ribosomal protein l12, partial [Phtheirospermum japonicum]
RRSVRRRFSHQGARGAGAGLEEDEEHQAQRQHLARRHRRDRQDGDLGELCVGWLYGGREGPQGSAARDYGRRRGASLGLRFCFWIRYLAESFFFFIISPVKFRLYFKLDRRSSNTKPLVLKACSTENVET